VSAHAWIFVYSALQVHRRRRLLHLANPQWALWLLEKVHLLKLGLSLHYRQLIQQQQSQRLERTAVVPLSPKHFRRLKIVRSLQSRPTVLVGSAAAVAWVNTLRAMPWATTTSFES
jgi:hypothetical protein